jgi:anthranilate phosphoribosyltransferase
LALGLSSPRAYSAGVLQELIQALEAGRVLSVPQVRAAVEQLTAGEVPAELKAGFLTALAAKGETFEEIAAFAAELRDRAVQPPLNEATRGRGILDVCGTGGDRLNTFNISTTVALVASAAGVTVAKHGNRAITSQAGSADVLEALGIRVELPPEEAAAWLRDHRFAFFFAPKYHPAFRHIAPARKLCSERGQRTIFNFLGPLLNPARPTAQLVGVPRPDLCEPLARVLQSLGLRRGMVVCGRIPGAGGAPDRHLDEISPLGDTQVAEFYHERGFALSTLSPADFPLQPVTLDQLAGGTARENADLVRAILKGRERGPKRDAVLLNTAAALWVAGRSRSLADGWSLAEETIDQGAARAQCERLVQISAG